MMIVLAAVHANQNVLYPAYQQEMASML